MNIEKENKFQLQRVGGSVTDEQLISDLKRVAIEVGTEAITQKLYSEFGQYDCSTQLRRFGTWNDALIKADLKISNEVNISDEKLFQNILVLWEHFGRQPRRRELSEKPSTISQNPYMRRFGSWGAALESFVEYINSTETQPTIKPDLDKQSPKRTPRDASLRLRFKVLNRDLFTCQGCGASPAKKSDVVLHVDHIHPYSKGGETTLENLRTFCSKCNLGKSDLIL